MAGGKSESIKEVALLTKSIEFVVRNLVKVIVGKITLVRLQEMIEAHFIEEAERYLRKERPGRDVPLTSLALVTGVDTRKLAQVRNSETYRKPKHAASEFVTNLTSESSIVELWTSDPAFTDLESGIPRVLDIWGEEGSFEVVVKQAIRSRGITVTSALERLTQGGLVRLDNNSKVELISTKLQPKSVRKHIGEVKLGLDAVGHLLGTVHRNLEAPVTGKDRLYQQGNWTHRLDPANRDRLESAMRDLLENARKEAVVLLERFEEPSAEEFQLSAGVGFYYFEVDTF